MYGSAITSSSSTYTSLKVSLGPVLEGSVACEPSAALVAGGYNRGDSGLAEQDVFLVTAEVVGQLGSSGHARCTPSPTKTVTGGWCPCPSRRTVAAGEGWSVGWNIQGGIAEVVLGLQFGGWVDGRAVVCGGEDSQGALYDDCWAYTPQNEDEWTLFWEMKVYIWRSTLSHISA
jgi:hypothetical protein